MYTISNIKSLKINTYCVFISMTSLISNSIYRKSGSIYKETAILHSHVFVLTKNIEVTAS